MLSIVVLGFGGIKFLFLGCLYFNGKYRLYRNEYVRVDMCYEEK